MVVGKYQRVHSAIKGNASPMMLETSFLNGGDHMVASPSLIPSMHHWFPLCDEPYQATRCEKCLKETGFDSIT